MVLAERLKVILHPYGEKTPVIRSLRNVGSLINVINCAKFYLYALVVFGWRNPENWVFPLS